MPLVLAVEVIFAAAFALWAVVRSYAPAITATEKPMDLAFLNSILRASYLPPPDPWLSGFSLNNYYFGHFMVALLSKLTGVPAGTAYNLAVAIFFGLSAIGIFGLVYNLVARSSGDEAQRKAIGFGLLGILFFLIASNLEGIVEFFYARGAGSPEFWKWVDIKGLNQPYASARWYPTEHWFFWRATRVIDTVVGGQSLDYTITEFPFFSFLLADMHAHLLAIPFVLMALGFTMNTLFTREPMGFRWLLRNPWELLVVIIGLGSLGVIHSWDLPTYAGIFVAAVFIQHYLAPAGGIRGRAVTAHPLPREGTSLLPSPELPVVPVSAARRLTGLPLLAPVVISLIVLAGVFFYYLPFYSAFQRPVTGVLPWIGPPTRSVYWLVLYGLFALIILPALIVEAASLKKDGQGAAKTLALLAPVMLGPLVIWTLLMMVVGPVTAGPASAASGIAIRWRNLIPFVLLALGALWVVIIRSKKVRQDSPWGLGSLYVALLLLAAILIIYGTELFFIKDVLFGNRMNTIFRFHYQVWLLLSVAAAFGVYYISARGRGLTAPWRISQIAWLAVTAVVFLGALYYPAAAASNYLNFKASRTLDGLAFVAPPERDALEWLRKNVPEGSVIAEAFGGDYTEAGRVAARTGIPTIIEWAEHQKIWRGADQDFKDRPRDVEAIFRSANVSQVRSLLAKYGVSYIYVGGFERQQYGDQVSTRFNGVADIVFRNQAATVYRVRAQ
ncbi:MAG: hypothetical protein HYY29_04590 [Chloroflexi bacterium]|nr:hypothetical protein [Chloroflexota bacterium]